MVLMSVKPFEKGDLLQVSFELPVKNSINKLTLTAEVCWSAPANIILYHVIGFRFIYAFTEMRYFNETLFDGLDL